MNVIAKHPFFNLFYSIKVIIAYGCKIMMKREKVEYFCKERKQSQKTRNPKSYRPRNQKEKFRKQESYSIQFLIELEYLGWCDMHMYRACVVCLYILASYIYRL